MITMLRECGRKPDVPKSSVCSTRSARARVKRAISGRKRQKRGAGRCSPADGSINGFADNLGKYCARQREVSYGKYGKFGSRRPCRPLVPVRNFFPSIREAGREGGEGEDEGKREAKRGTSGKIGNGSTFLADEREKELASVSLSFRALYCCLLLDSPRGNLVVELSLERIFGSARPHVAGEL